MLDKIRHWLAAPTFEGDEDKTRRGRLLNTVLLAFLVPLLLYAAGAIALPNPEAGWTMAAIVIAMDLGALALLRRGQVQRASRLLCEGIWLFMTVVCALFGGVSSPAVFGYVIVVIMAGLLLGGWWPYIFSALATVGAIGIMLAGNLGWLPEPLGGNPPIATVLVVALFAAVAAILLRTTMQGLDDALARSRRAAAQLERERGRLEETVQTRTQDLSRRAAYLETTASIARDAAQVLDLEQLLPRIAALIADRLGFYHCGIFMLDAVGEYAVLQAASSEGGQRMLAHSHRLRAGSRGAAAPSPGPGGASLGGTQGEPQSGAEWEGVVGYAITHGEARVALDVGADAAYFDNPDLPATRSEIALPLRAGDEILGALDVQSDEPQAFSAEDAQVLQTLADQVAVAISNARLFQQAEESVEAERRAYGEASRQGWIDMLRSAHDRQSLGFRYTRQGVVPVPRDAPQEPGGEPAEPPEQEPVKLMLPILHRGQTFGAIQAHKRGGGQWTAAETALMQTLADQLSVALESARLFEESQRRAAREQMIGEVTARMRETLDVEAVIKTAADEIYKAMELDQVVIRLGR